MTESLGHNIKYEYHEKLGLIGINLSLNIVSLIVLRVVSRSINCRYTSDSFLFYELCHFNPYRWNG